MMNNQGQDSIPAEAGKRSRKVAVFTPEERKEILDKVDRGEMPFDKAADLLMSECPEWVAHMEEQDEKRSRETVEDRRRKSFADTNADFALSGIYQDAEGLAIQEKVIKGEWTHEEAAAFIIAKARSGGYGGK